jgi:hypothetical protein
MSETLLDQLETDLTELFQSIDEYKNMVVKQEFNEYPKIQYPMIVISELENSDNERYYDGEEHIVNVGYQFTILAKQSSTLDASKNVRQILDIIKDYMRGERYHALVRQRPQPIVTHPNDTNVRIGYVRYVGCINIDTNTIYRRN